MIVMTVTMMISYLTSCDVKLPDIHIAPDLHACHPITFIDTSAGSFPLIDELDASQKLHIAYITTPDMLTWNTDLRSQFFSEMHAIVAASEYLKQQMSAFINTEIEVLPMPVSGGKVGKKEKRIVAIGSERADNIEGIQAVFESLSDWETVLLPHDAPERFDVLSTAWAYIDMSRTSRYPFNFISAGLAGCFNFVWHFHAYADKYPVYRFEDADEAVLKIEEVYETTEGTPNKDIQKYMTKLHSPANFKKNLKNLVNSLIFS